jgi:poly-gamma-glutamate synthesis protein (capsule biosynthesis protein)
VAVGDILMHEDVKRSARESGSGLQSLWADVEPLLRDADVAFANLETPVAPRTGRPGQPFQFNASEDLPAALRASGFTVLATANNHTFDQGLGGVQETLERLRAEKLTAVGSGATRREAETPRILQVHGLKLAFLAFTDIFNADLNGEDGKPWVRPLDPAAAVEAVRAARLMADAVVVSVHWGVEYEHRPHPRQRQVAAQLAAAGADLILGHHPHVLQPVEILVNGGRRTVVVYSMGNFVSNQDRMYLPGNFPVAGGDNRDGVAVSCRLVKQRGADGQDRVVVEDPICEPLWTENNWPEHSAGQADIREIRVIRVNRAIRRVRRELERPALGEGDQARIRAARERLRLLLLRRTRAVEILGAAWVAADS